MLPSSLPSVRTDERSNVDPPPLVEFRIPPEPEYVRIARLIAGDMGGRVGFSIDELDDLRLAVVEVCALLIDAGGDVLELCMHARGRELTIEGRSVGARFEVVPSELSEMLLSALVDSCTFTAGEDVLSFKMCKLAREIA
jgi:serine/threonine-protein kinase RsbW